MGRERIKYSKTALLCGLVSTAICFSIRILTESPFDMIHKLNCASLLPPIWLFNLLSILWGFLFGYAAGLVIRQSANRGTHTCILLSAYRGGLCYLCAFFLSCAWYPLLFGAGRLFIAFLVAFWATVFSALCALCWFRVSSSATLIVAAYTLWMVYVFCLLFIVFFKN